MKFKYIIPSVLISVATIAARGDAFDDAVSAIMANSSELVLERERDSAELLSLKSENRLADPELSFSHDWGMKHIGNKWSVGISQSFDWPGLYKSRSEESSRLKSAMALKQDATTVETRLKVRQALIEYIGTCKQLALDRELLKHFDTLLHAYTQTEARGEMNIIDVNKLKVEQASASRKVSEDIAALDEAVARLEQLNGGHHCHELLEKLSDYPETILLPEEHYKELAEQHNPTVSYLSAMTEVADIQYKTAGLERLPGFSVGYLYAYELGDRFNGISLGITLPFYSNKSKRNAAIINRHTYEIEAENTVRQSVTEISHDYKALQIIAEELESLRPIINDTNVMRLLDKARDGGEMNLLTYIQEVCYFASARADYISLEKEYHSRLAQLNKFVK